MKPDPTLIAGNQKSVENYQTSKKNNSCSKSITNSRTNEHLYITIDTNILKKQTESKSKSPDPNPEKSKVKSRSKRLSPYPEKSKESKSSIRIQILRNPKAESKSNESRSLKQPTSSS